jgi:hypothetical protein
MHTARLDRGLGPNCLDRLRQPGQAVATADAEELEAGAVDTAEFGATQTTIAAAPTASTCQVTLRPLWLVLGARPCCVGIRWCGAEDQCSVLS